MERKMRDSSKEKQVIKRNILKRAVKTTVQVGLFMALIQAEEDVRYVVNKWLDE